MEKTSSTKPTSAEINILRWFRERIISFLTTNYKLKLVDNFTVSTAGKNGFSLDIKFNGKQTGYLDMVTKIETELKTPGLFTTTTQQLLVVNLKEATKNRLTTSSTDQQLTKKPAASPKDKTPKKAKYQTLLGDLRIILSKIMPDEELSKSYVLKKYEGRSDGAEVQINDVQLMNDALYLVESQGYKATSIGTRLICGTSESQFIETLPHHVKVTSQTKQLRSWMEQVSHWMQETGINAKIASHPLKVAQSNFQEDVTFICENNGMAGMLEAGFNGNDIDCKKNGKTVYVRVTVFVAAKPFLQIKLSKKGLFFKNNEGEGAKYVHQTLDYNELHLLPFNRKIDPDHVEAIAKSMDEFGVIDFVKVVETKCVDGTLKKWIVDGQHTYSAEKKRSLPVLYILIRIETLTELVRLTAVLNNRRRPWKSKDYLNAWLSLHVPVYQTVNEWIAKKMGFSLILEALSGRDPKAAMVLFKDGNFVPESSNKGVSLLQNIYDLKSLLPKSMKVQTGVMRFIKNCESYDHAHMKKVLEKKKGKVIFGADDTIQIVTQRVSEIYYQKN